MARQSITNYSSFVEYQKGKPVFVGIDVHKKNYSVAILGRDSMLATFICSSDVQALIKKFKESGLNIQMITYEAGPTGFGLARGLMEAGFAVIVAAPSRIPRPVTKSAKTDRLDCIKLAEYTSAGMLKSIAIPTEKEEAVRSYTRRRCELMDSIRRVKLRIKSLLLRHGIQEPRGLKLWSAYGVAALEQLSLIEGIKDNLKSLVRELNFFLNERAEVEKKLKELSQASERSEIISSLRSVPGVGLIVASTFCSEIFRPERFTRGDEVASYLGLAPMVRESGEGKSKGILVQVGQKRLRSLLIEAAWRWKSKDPWAGEQYRKLISGSGLFQKAISALARKLAIILWRLSIEKRSYKQINVAA